MNPSKLRLRSRWTKRPHAWSCVHKRMNELWLVPVIDANEIYSEILMSISSRSMPFSVRSSTRLSSTGSCSWTSQQTISTLSRCSQLNDLSSSSPMNLWCVWPTWNVRKHKFHFDLIAHASTSVQGSINMWREPCTPLSFRVRFSRLGEFWRKTING